MYVFNVKAVSILLKVGGFEICISEGIHSLEGRQINSFVLHKGTSFEKEPECFLLVLEKEKLGYSMFSFNVSMFLGKRKSCNIQRRNELMIMKEFAKCCATLKTEEG